MSKLAGRGRTATETYPSSSASAGAPAGLIAWRPDGSGNAKTWADVMVRVAASLVPPIINVAAMPLAFPYVIPASPTPYPLKFATFSGPLSAPVIVIDVDDGAVLSDLSTVSGDVGLRFHPTTADALKFTVVSGAPAILAIQRAAHLQNQGTVPIYTVQPNSGSPGFVLASFENGNVDSGASPLIALAANATAIMEVVSAFNTGGSVPPNIFSGPASASVILLHDGTLIFPFTPQPAFLGTLLNAPLGCSPSGGPTAMRPVALGTLSVGVSYFDQGLAPPREIWWDGTQWVDGAGTPV